MNIKKFIGTKAFYKMVLALTIPIIIQNGITNFVNLLDNVMVGTPQKIPCCLQGRRIPKPSTRYPNDSIQTANSNRRRRSP